ncbi:hypothetical protein [Halarcobacter sp.]|uniref:ORC-CDC6 family AAA ATPase n=1 Tax=Halarcobacter sp. TaxID=2321133 RepID=UPI002AA72B7A|nr:hypothetical protein [Halarcobacter sp.]
MTNPFSVVTPENITSDDIKSLFVESIDFKSLEKKGHTFIHGHRGCGKSMALQVLRSKNYIKYKGFENIKDLPFICIYIPIKRSVLASTELERLKNDILEKYFAEHMLCLHFAINICKELIDFIDYKISLDEKEINVFKNKIGLLGFDVSNLNNDFILKDLLNLFELNWSKDNLIRRKMSIARRPEDISEPSILTTYHDFLLPLIKFLKKFDKNRVLNKDILLLIDDADNLPLVFTEILNEWVLYRDTENISFKISTQLKYKTFRTISNSRIEKPHDYNEIIFSYVVSSEKKKEYTNFVKDIVEKRLKTINIDSTAYEFLPEKKSQVKRIQEISEEFKKKWHEGKGKGNQVNDDAYRYARSDYIKELGGKRKQKSNYSYSGFKQLVNISSGIIRHFLEPLSKMYSEQLLKNPKNLEFIESSIQDNIIKRESDNFFTSQFEHLEKEITNNNVHEEKIIRLKNFITAIGQNFHYILLSDLSERRVFSFTISDEKNITTEIKEILKLAIEYGLLYESKIGKKNSPGRTELYILTRVLAPYFKLDPNGFSGYQSLTTEWIKCALTNPNQKLAKLRQEDNNSLKNIQPTLPGF